jgi:Mce-associated membrane protein
MAENTDDAGREPGETAGGAGEPVAAPAKPAPAESRPGTVSIQVSSLVRGAVVAVLAVAAIVFAVLYFTARGELADRDERAAADSHAEQLATEYAVGAATVNFKDLDAWIAALKKNTSPQLAGKFDETAPKLEQILVPLQWTSTAAPITAKVMSEQDGVRKVNVFVNVTSTNAQNPDGTQTTVTYTVTVDENSGRQITDVGGVDGALPMK